MIKDSLKITTGQYSEAGRKKINQDCYGVMVPNEPQLTSKGIAVALADGISSSNVSQIASEASVRGFLSDYYCTSDAWSVKHSAQAVLKAINSWLYAQTQQSSHRFNKDKGYVCTFSGIIFKSNTAHIFHSGDSRIYRLSQGHLEQLTQDHRHQLSEETSYLTRALGIHDYLEIDYVTAPIKVDDIFILATDGVYEFWNEQMLTAELTKPDAQLPELAQRIVAAALAAGSDDNLTLQLAQIDAVPSNNMGEMQRQALLLPAPPKLTARMDFEGFSILREIYISSRSHVFLAKHNDSDEHVVIKTPSSEMRDNQEYLQRFIMEDWIARRVNHANILRALTPRKAPNYLYILTEFVEGQTLAQWMADNKTPALERVRDITAQIAAGLQAFHRQEMVHQDLRPANVMIDVQGTVKIIDFGAVKVAGLSEIQPSNEGIMGTAQYTAPEYFLGELGSHQADIFSLGVMVYQMLSGGSLPYGNAVSKVRSHRDCQALHYQPLSQLKNPPPAWVDFAIAKALNPNPFKRYQEVSEFVYDLRHPNPRYLQRTQAPIIERNPILFWQVVSLILLVVVIYQASH